MRSGLALALVLWVAPVEAGAGQGPGALAGAGLIAAVGRDAFLGPALALALTGGGRTRGSVLVAAGRRGDAEAARLELSAELVAQPGVATLYGGLGALYEVARDSRGAGYVLVYLGVERVVGRRLGWFAEVGLGGGVRAVAGVRLRVTPL